MSNIIIVKKMKRAYTHDQDSASQRKSLHTQTDPDYLFQYFLCDLSFSKSAKIVTESLELLEKE